MKLKTADGKTWNVLKVGPVQAFALTVGACERVTVAEGEFEDEGEVLLYQEGEMDPRRYEREYNEVMERVKGTDLENVPLIAILLHNQFVDFGAKYHLERRNGVTEMVLGDIFDFETPFTIDENGLLVEAASEDDEDEGGLIPIPPPPKNCSDELYLTMAYEPYDQIKRGEKKTEFREYNQTWVKRILSHPLKTVKFQRGYGGPGRPTPEQMVWTIKKISLYEMETKREGDPWNPPDGINPTFIAIELGERVS